MVMMFVGGIVFIVDGISVLFLLQGIHGVGFFVPVQTFLLPPEPK